MTNFAMSPERAYLLLECIAQISGTEDRLMKMKPEGNEIEDQEIAVDVAIEAKRGPFRFSECSIPVGATLSYVNDPAVEVTVVDDRHILYKGMTTSMTAAAQDLLGIHHSIQGTLFFMYKGEKLTDIRDRMERGRAKS